MRYQAVMMLFSGAIGLCLSGCAATTPTMRAQSPNASFAGYSCGQEHGGANCQSCDGGYGMMGMPVNCHSGVCPPGGGCRTGGACGPGCDGSRCLNVPFHPVHRNFHTYDVPSGLEYPQDNQPPAVYQYPYYTTRGPTDFFMK